MKHLVLFAAVAIQQLSAAVLPKLCYETLEGQQFCTTDNLGKVQVLIYNAGWCPPCNEEMHELSQTYSQFAGKDVVFASLSGEGFSHGAKPDAAFLKSWKSKHSIPFVVAGKYKDFGGSFGNPGSIPFAVIVDANGSVVQSGYISASEINRKVNSLINDSQTLNIVPQQFFSAIQGKYIVQSVAGKPPHDPSNFANIYTDSDLPDSDVVYMPYCVEQFCMDSGNTFVREKTRITRVEAGYHIVFNSDGKDLRYDWLDLGEGNYLFRNYQFKDQSDTPYILEHVIRKATN